MKAPMDGILFCCFKDIHLPFSLNESQIRESIFESKRSCLSFCSNMMKSESRTQSDTMITLLLLFFLITATLTFSYCYFSYPLTNFAHTSPVDMLLTLAWSHEKLPNCRVHLPIKIPYNE